MLSLPHSNKAKSNVTERISARCPDCGHGTFNIPDSDDEQVVCAGCGAEMGTKRACLADLEEAKRDIADSAFGGFGGSTGGFTKPKRR